MSTEYRNIDLANLLPAEAGEFKAIEKDRFFDSDNLHELIDGDSEVYRALNLHASISRRYVKPGCSDILVDVLEMGSCADAFGAYHHDLREGEQVGIGKESEYLSGCLYFWKHRYFVSILNLQENPEMKRVVLELGRRVAEHIPAQGKLPKLVEWLPAEGLMVNQLYYFHDWLSLNRRYFLAEENLLGLDGYTEGLLARYHPSSLLLLIRYPDEKTAAQAHLRFGRHYLPDSDFQGAARMEDGTWVAVCVQGPIWIGAFESPSRRSALGLVNHARSKIGK